MKQFAVSLALFLALMTSQSVAASTDWVEIMPGAKMRAVSSGTEMDGRSLFGIDIVLDQAIKTYWRVPGETGLPTSVTATNGDTTYPAQILWPLPEWDVAEGYVDLVYREAVTLPVLIAMPKGEPVRLDVMMGVCSDICVPFRVSLELAGDAKPDMAISLHLKQAVNETPIAWTGENPPLSDLEFDDALGTLTVTFDPERIDPLQVFPTLDGTPELFAPPRVDMANKTLSFQMLVPTTRAEWRSAPLRLTFATGEGPYEIVRDAETR